MSVKTKAKEAQKVRAVLHIKNTGIVYTWPLKIGVELSDRLLMEGVG